MIADATTQVETQDARAGRPLVSIGMPVYNAQDYLSQALDAILAQSYPYFEVIISDSGSSDRTQEICQDYANRDSRIRYEQTQEALSVTQNYNRTVELAQGEYFKWAAPDDLIAHTFLARCVAVLGREPDVVVCYPRTRLIDETGTALGTYTDELDLRSSLPHRRLRKFYDNQGLSHPIYGLVRLDALRRSGMLGDFPMADRVLLSELALLGEISEIPAYLFLRRIHSGFSARVFAAGTWFNPRAPGQVQFPRWRGLVEYLNVIQRAELGLVETTRCYMQLAHFVFIPKQWAGLMGEASSLLTPRALTVRRASRSSHN
jgi:glycosyltransferase involved in cell wall biosynthesis